MPAEMITSTKNPKIINLRKLTQRKHRRAQGCFAVEGLQLLGMVLTAGHIPRDVFYCEDHFTGDIAPKVLLQLLAAGGRGHPLHAKVMQTLSERDSPQGIIATFSLFEMNLSDLQQPSHTTPSLIVVVDRLQDPGNLGTLIRTADAVAANGIILIEPCVDPFDPKTVRGSMGSLFNVPLVRTTDPAALAYYLQGAGYKLTGADGYQGEIPWLAESDCLGGDVALYLGNEAQGLSEDLRSHLTHWVRLPLRGQAESLNVAVAGGVLMYQWVAQQDSKVS